MFTDISEDLIIEELKEIETFAKRFEWSMTWSSVIVFVTFLEDNHKNFHPGFAI